MDGENMDQGNAPAARSDVKHIGSKSWTAFIGITLAMLLLFPVLVIIAWSASWIAGLIVLVISILYVIYKVLVIRSYRLYHDEVGVWVYSGVLPWKKGVAGVKWRDLDEAVYFQTLWSWLFKSYSMRIGHRFTKSSEIFLSHMARGHNSVVEINSRHQELIRSGALK